MGKIPVKIIDEKVKLYWKSYLLQSLLATLIIFILLLFLKLLPAVIIASIGATTFIVFAMPRSRTAKPRSIIGGHLIGLVCGTLAHSIPHSSSLFTAIVYAIAVGLSIFLMVILDAEHPPASGTALGVAIEGFSISITIAVIVSSIMLGFTECILKSRLKDLV